MDPGTLIVFILSIIITVVTYELNKPKAPQPPTPNALNDFQLPLSDEGTPQPVVFGEGWISASFILWYGNLTNSPIVTSGGKK